MTPQPKEQAMPSEPDWAEKEARCIVGRIAGDVITGWQSEDIRRATSAAKRAEDRIAAALRAARTVPPGYARVGETDHRVVEDSVNPLNELRYLTLAAPSPR